MFTLEQAFSALFEINMGVKDNERILVFTDEVGPGERPSPDDADRRRRLWQVASEAGRFALRTYGSGMFLSFPATSASGSEPPEILWREAFGGRIVDSLVSEGILLSLLGKTATPAQLTRAREIVLERKEDVVHVVVAMANNSTSHTRFRSLINMAGGRFASLPHFDPEMFFTSMRVDWVLLAERTSKLAERINRAGELLVETGNGTRMYFCKKGRIAAGDDGLLTQPGSFGNLPAGEVYVAPLEGVSKGVMVLEYAPMRKLASPLELIVEEGRVAEIRGDEPYRKVLEKKLAESPRNSTIAELGIGTNERASRPDNILEAEKILGTIHIALGDNSGFGGTVSTPFHEDYVFYGPTLTAIGEDGVREVLLADGRIRI